MGVIHDLVVECASGSVTHVVIATCGEGSVGDTLRRLPFYDARFERSAPGEIRLTVTEAKFDASVELTQAMLDAYRSEAIVGRPPVVREAHSSLHPKEHSPLAGGLCMLMLASELDDLAVRSTAEPTDGISQARSGESMGSVDEVWLDCSNGRVAYCSLRHDGRVVVLPMEVCVPSLDPQRSTLFLATPCTARGLAEAPALDAQLDRTVDNAGFRTLVAEFYARCESEPTRALDGERVADRR